MRIRKNRFTIKNKFNEKIDLPAFFSKLDFHESIELSAFATNLDGDKIQVRICEKKKTS